jgi:GT2 family glycosyltransferase
MNTLLEPKLKIKKNNIKWLNWESFIYSKIENILHKEYLIALVTFNSSDSVISLLDQILSEKRIFDILIVDNNSDETHFKKLKKYCENNKLTLIKLKENLGCAGGNSIIVEYSLKNNYENIILTEDDVILLQKKTVSRMILESKKNKNTIIHIKYAEFMMNSFSLHFTLYPKNLLKQLGCLNVNYFMRSEDFEWGSRIQNLKYPRVVINDLFYSHPIFKKDPPLWLYYFSIRNGLYSTKVQGSSYFFKQFFISFIYMLSSWAFLLKDKNKKFMLAINYAFLDFILNKKSSVLNKKRHKQFLEKLYEPQFLNVKKIKIKDLKRSVFKNYFPTSQVLSTMQKIINLSFSKFSLNKQISLSYYSPAYAFNLLAKDLQVVTVLNKDFIEFGRVIGSENNYPLVFLALLLASLNYVIFLPFLIIKVIFNKIKFL